MDVKPPISFVTGATGFLGSHLVDQLLEKGHEVHVLVRKSSNLQWLLGKPVRFHYGDLARNRRGLSEGVQSADYVFHIAGVIAARRAETYYQVNTIGTANLLEACLESPRLKNIIVVTSLAAHGPGEAETPARETDPCRPITDYGKSKQDAELVVSRYRDRLPITVVRPPAIYGPRDVAILNFFKLAKRGLLCVPMGSPCHINIAHVLDVVQGILLAAEQPGAVGETFHIGDEQDYSWEEITHWMGRALHKKPLILKIPKELYYGAGLLAEGGAWLLRKTPLLNRGQAKNFVQKNWRMDIHKAKKILGFRPQVPLPQGLEQTAVWYENERWL